MGKLFLLLFGARKLLLFLFLELICFWLIVRFNTFQSTSFYNSSSAVAGSVLSITSGITGYFDLDEGNRQLSMENASLNNEVTRLRQQLVHLEELKNQNILLKKELAKVTTIDSLGNYRVDSLKAPHLQPLEYVPSKVISNTIHKDHNFVTLDKGSKDGIELYMGVVGPSGLVGKVQFVSENYCTVRSLLHPRTSVSVKIKTSGELGSAVWYGDSYRSMSLISIPRHVAVAKGDTVVTSGFNSVYPSGIPVGTISELELPDSETFYDIKFDLINDFSKLDYVYIVVNQRKKELSELQQLREGEDGR